MASDSSNNTATSYYLTNYYYENSESDESFSNFVLAPLVIALGRKVTLSSKTYDIKQIKITEEKAAPVAYRILAAFGALIILPITLLGLGVRAISENHCIHVGLEDLFKKHQQDTQALQREIKQYFSPQTNALTPVEKIARMTQLGQFIDRGLTQRLNIEIEPLVEEFKNQLEQMILKNDQGTPIGVKEEFKKEMSCEALRSFKRMLTQLCWHEKEYRINPWFEGSLKLKECHKVIRQFYYEKFAGEHFVRNLREKGDNSKLGVKLQDFSNQEKWDDAVLDVIQEAYSTENNPSQVKWEHGTQSPTMVSMAMTDRLLKSPSQMLKDKQLAPCGEQNRGYFHINDIKIYGVSLEKCNMAINYSRGGLGYCDEIAPFCITKPEQVINEIYHPTFEEYLQKLTDEGKSYLSFLNESYPPKQIGNLHRHFKILWSLEPKLFEEKMLPSVIQLIAKLKEFEGPGYDQQTQRAAQSLLEEMLEPILNFKTTLPSHPETDRKIFQSCYPVVFGATGIKLVDEVHADKTQKVAYHQGDMCNEYIYEGSPLKLGSDLPFIFVPQSRVNMTRAYLKGRNIHDVKVYNMESLQLASTFSKYLLKKLDKFKEKHFFDRSWLKKP